jgi:3-methyladenine DNA glycosylase/8-oxoguanine DNA glycosylase
VSDAAIRHLRSVDPRLASVIDAVGPFMPRRDSPTFDSLARAVIGQQISTSAAASIYGRMQALSGGAITPERIMTATDEELRSAGLSRAKVVTLRGLAGRALSSELVVENLHTLDDEAVVAELSKSRGIGRWTAEMYLIFALGREDVLPLGDLGFRTAMLRIYGDTIAHTPAGLTAHGDRWRPYRSIATWYLWRSLRLRADRFESV